MFKNTGIWTYATMFNHRLLILYHFPGSPPFFFTWHSKEPSKSNSNLSPHQPPQVRALTVSCTSCICCFSYLDDFSPPFFHFQYPVNFRKFSQFHAYVPNPFHSLYATHAINLLFISMHSDYKLWDKTEKIITYLLEDSLSSSETKHSCPAALSPFWFLWHRLSPRKSIVTQYTNHGLGSFTEQNVIRSSVGTHKCVPQLLWAFSSSIHPKCLWATIGKKLLYEAASLSLGFWGATVNCNQWIKNPVLVEAIPHRANSNLPSLVLFLKCVSFFKQVSLGPSQPTPLMSPTQLRAPSFAITALSEDS